MPGDVLRSQEPALSVSSALEVLTVVFGMGTRVSPPPSSPDLRGLHRQSQLSCHRPCTLETRYLLCFASYSPTTQVKPSTDSYPSAPRITTLPRRTDLPCLLQGVLLHCWMGYVILGEASRLDAFSAYPFPTWLPSGALGRTTGTPAVGSSRSSRTKDESSHVSYARGR